MEKKVPFAIAYDFDGTLASGNMQDCLLEKGLKTSAEEFWKKCRVYAKEKNMDEILVYMYFLVETAQSRGCKLAELFEEYGKKLTFFAGVESWFERLDEFASSRGVELSHYIISSGLREMISASQIASKFRYIWACEFMYGNGRALWPKLAINYTGKTQYLFRINKGIENSYENESLNQFTPAHKRQIPFTNMIYIGDGATDVPSMKMIRHQGGKAIAVYDSHMKDSETKKQKCKDLQLQDRVNYYVKADYSEGSQLDLIVKDILQYVSQNYT